MLVGVEMDFLKLQDAWKNWINWDAPFREDSDAMAAVGGNGACLEPAQETPSPKDQLNRQRKFFWEVDDKVEL